MATTGAKTTNARKTEEVRGSDLEEDIRQLRADMAQLASHLKALGGQTGEAARKAAGESVDHLFEQGEAALRSVKGNAQEVERELAQAIRNRPITSLALAVGAGFLLALATRR